MLAVGTFEWIPYSCGTLGNILMQLINVSSPITFICRLVKQSGFIFALS